MTLFLTIQNTYKHIEVALFKDDQLFGLVRENKIRASKTLIPLVAYLLLKAHLPLNKLSFISVNQGPGPFTTLRVVIATANGLSFATKVPLIGIDALDAILQEYADPAGTTVALLNAFHDDVYFGIKQTNSTVHEKGYNNIVVLLETLKTRFLNQSIHFLGNGVELHKERIVNAFGSQAIIPELLPQTCSIKRVGLMALDAWNNHGGKAEQLQPLYLKKAL